MAMIDGMLMELEFEAGNTRKVLERVPLEHFDWKPHEKSMEMGRLASHVADIPGWVAMILNADFLDVDTDYHPFSASSTEELVATFDAKIAEAKSVMPGYSDEKLLQNWALRSGGQEMFSMPRAQHIRGFVLSHTIHHRAQLGMYLRLKDIPVPSIYGPSADEQP